ncbi:MULTISPECIES: hypothetical protein [unclassified Agrococcus]|uniref:hypothetical protein n=1 Tax=unclassified Agrococcus TaxID=2615065 RepID=UPI00360F4832
MTERDDLQHDAEAAAPGDDDILVPDDAPESGPLTPSDDPDGGPNDGSVGSPP